MDYINYSTSCAISDAFKSLGRNGAVTTMRVVGLALFVAGLFVVAKLATSIYVDATESQDQTTLRGLKISAGIETGCFTDERLDSLRQKPEIERIERLYTILPTLLYQDASTVAILESVSSQDVLFGKERMRVGRGPQAPDETTLTKPLADRLGIKEEEVKKRSVVITSIQERTRDGAKESSERRLNVVGICRGTNEVGYVLESDAATMNAWASGAITSTDEKSKRLVKGAFVFLTGGVSPELEEYAKRTNLSFKQRNALKIPRLKTSTWCKIEPKKTDANSYMKCPTCIVDFPKETFVVLSEGDPRLTNRTTSFVASEVNLDSSSTFDSINNESQGSFKQGDYWGNPLKNDLFEEYAISNTTSRNKSDKSRRLSQGDGTVFNKHSKLYESQTEPLLKSGNINEQKRHNQYSHWKDVNENGWDSSYEGKLFLVKKDCDVQQTFGFNPKEGKPVRIVTQLESRSILYKNQKTLADILSESRVHEEIHVYLEANVNVDELFYRRAYSYDAITPFTEQELEEIRVFEFDTTEETPEETSKRLVDDLRAFDVRFVKEKATTEATINGVLVSLIGGQKNDLENKLRLAQVEEQEEAKGLELNAQDAQALGAFEWKLGGDVPICFTRILRSGKEQKIELKYRFLGVGVETKIPIKDLKNIILWQNDELAYDERDEKFVDLAVLELARGSYSARILAKSTDDAAKLASDLTTLGYAITESGVDNIEGTKVLLRNLTSFVALFNISGLALCLLNLITTDFLVIRLRKKDVAAMIDLGVARVQLFKEIFAETVVTALLALVMVVALALTVGKPLAQSLIALTGVTISDFELFDLYGVKILIGAGVLTLALATLAQISTIIFLTRYKRPTSLRK